MKHPFTPTAIIIILFVCAQLIGLGLLVNDINLEINEETGEEEVVFSETIAGPRPETTGGESFALILGGVLIGTILLLILIRFNQQKIWKLWYALAVWMAISIALGTILPAALAWIIGILATGLKLYKQQPIINNITEIFVYAGIGLLVVPLFEIVWAVLLLIAISIYDAYAVWKSKHMIALAQFQTKSNLFAGLSVPYQQQKTPAQHSTKKTTHKTIKQVQTAILGGGDIVFPLILSGTLLHTAVQAGLSKLSAYILANSVTIGATAGLLILFLNSKPGKFYPAMPFITAGCLIGLGIALLIL